MNQFWKPCENPGRQPDAYVKWCDRECGGCHELAAETRKGLLAEPERAEIYPHDWSVLSRIIERTQQRTVLTQ